MCIEKKVIKMFERERRSSRLPVSQSKHSTPWRAKESEIP